MTRPQAEDGFNPKPGEAETLLPGVRRLLAPNPSPMTYLGTNTYLVGTSDIAVIDPGPQNATHLEAILAALAPDQRISHILVTHSHLDHSPLAADLKARTGAPIYAFGKAEAGRSPIMQQLAEAGLVGGGEGIDHAFRCDHTLADGDQIAGSDWSLVAHHTPGHIGNHLCFALGDVLFSGDHIMGWASSLVSPPDGDLTDFMASCRALLRHDWSLLLPGHGAPVTQAAERISWLLTHREQRESEILAALKGAPASPDALARLIYTEVAPALLPAATRNVFAHLVDLYQRKQVAPEGLLTAQAVFHLAR